MRNILVYGSLRSNSRRGYNYNRFGPQMLLGQDCIIGFQLYSRVNGSYPAALYTGNPNDKIIVEAHGVDEKILQSIFNMEVRAGYTFGSFTTSNIGLTGIMFYIDNLHKTDMLVQSGDWD